MMGVRNVVLGVSKTATLRQNVLSQSPRSGVSTIRSICTIGMQGARLEWNNRRTRTRKEIQKALTNPRPQVVDTAEEVAGAVEGG